MVPSLPPAMVHCETQSSPDWCAQCEHPTVLHLGRCVEHCPEVGYFQGESNGTSACLTCYYSCKTCSGPNDYQCESCYGDAELDESLGSGKFCHNKGLIFKIFSSSRWYYVLSIGFLVNFLIVVVLTLYIIRRRRARDGKISLLDRVKQGGSRYSPVGSAGPLVGKKAGSKLPFNDYEESESDEAEDFMKPYSDEPSSSPSFLKPYKDDEGL